MCIRAVSCPPAVEGHAINHHDDNTCVIHMIALRFLQGCAQTFILCLTTKYFDRSWTMNIVVAKRLDRHTMVRIINV